MSIPTFARCFAAVLACHLLWVLLAVASPAFANEPLMPSYKAGSAVPEGHGLVFGRVVLVEDGQEKNFSLFTELSIFVTSLDSGQTERIRFLGENSFYWALKPGEYVVSAYFYNRTSGRIWAAFTVPDSGRGAYIGNLVLHFDTKSRRYSYSIADRYTEMLDKEAARLAAVKIDPVKALMRPEQRLGSYRRIAGICAKYWELECTRSNQGVEPVLPQGTHEGFPPVSSLTPLVEWKPVKLEGVSYDVAVYEVLELSFASKQQGKLAAYVEGLTEPRLQLDAPLKPGKRYFWSVRLRKEDTVSSWSTTGYFVFFVVGAVSGSGGWFGFLTPDP